MTPVYTPAKALRLIKNKTAQGEYNVSGWLYLRGCDLKGVTLPTTVSGSLYLGGCKNTNPDQWWAQGGEATRRHCIAMCPIDGYALIQTDADRFFAGCQKNMTREQALRHWDRADARAEKFTAAIRAHEVAA